MTQKDEKRKLNRWYYEVKVLSFIDDKENVVTKEEWERYKGKYDNPTDEILDAILNLLRTFHEQD
jgi:hypothetical protein